MEVLNRQQNVYMIRHDYVLINGDMIVKIIQLPDIFIGNISVWQ